MNNELTKQIPEVQKTAATAVVESSALDKEAQAAILAGVKDNSKLLTDYSKNVASAIESFKERLAKTDVNIAEELSKMKGQSEARYKETLAQVTALKTEIFVELEKRGLVTSRGTWMKNFNAGFIEIAGQRVPVAALIVSLALTKQTAYVFNESGDTAEQTWTEFFYSTSGEKSFSVPSRPLRLSAGQTFDPYMENVRSISVVDAANVVLRSVKFYENVKPVLSDINLAFVNEIKVTSPAQKKGALKNTILIEVLAGIGVNYVVVDYDKTYTLHPTLNLQAVLVQLGALAISTVNGTAGLMTSVFGQGLWDKVMGDVKAAPQITKG